jgi:hypothetical protein
MKRLTATAATLALAGFGLVGIASPSSAVTEHCPDHQTADKVELDGDVRTLTGLTPGDSICFKAGTQVFEVIVPASGEVTSPKGISYYIVTPGYGTPGS